MKNLLGKLFRFKSFKLNDVSGDTPINSVPEPYRQNMLDVIRAMNIPMRFNARYDTINGMDDGLVLFFLLAEVAFPIDYIASRIAGAHFEIKRVSDDSIVWCTGRSYKAQKIARILSRPNCLQRWNEFVYMHIVNKLATGNAFMRAAMGAGTCADTPKWKWCDNLWSIPASCVSIDSTGRSIPLFGITNIDELINGYRLISNNAIIPTWQIWHDRDGFADLSGSKMFLAHSRLESVYRNISNLKNVYDARNIIYSRCGALGIITNKTSDVTGHVKMSPSEKEELRKNYSENYGVTGSKAPVLISDKDLGYLATGMNIVQLQPFEETLLDAIVIAGRYGIPDVLVPRKDHSTFSNQSTAEKGVYSGVIIPMAKTFCSELTEFLRTEDEGYYIDCNFDNVDCLQVGRKESEEVNTMVNDRCRQQFNDGLISINDWRAQIHESALDGDVFNKTKFEMTDQEIMFISRVINSGKTTNPQQENGTENDKSAIADKD